MKRATLILLLFSIVGYAQNGTYQANATTITPYSSLSTIITTIGSNQATVHINKSFTITSNLTIPENISLKFYNGSVLTINNGITLAIFGAIDAGPFQIFNCIGTGLVNGTPKIKEVLPEWWQSPSNTTSWNSSILRSCSFYKTVLFSSERVSNNSIIPRYIIDSNLIIPKENTIRFSNRAVITINSGVTLTINGTIDAEPFQIFNCFDNTSLINGFPIIEQCYPEWWQTPNPDPTTSWSNSIQRALDFFPKVYLNAKEQFKGYYVDSTIYLDLDRHETTSFHIYGSGRGSYIETDNFTGFVFQSKDTPMYGFNNGLVIENISFFCRKGIEIINLDTEDFTNEYRSILNVKINNCKFIYNGGQSSPTEENICISLKKVFDSCLSNNYIFGFGIGIQLEGSDINTIRDNRIQEFYNYAIKEVSHNSFGSQNLITHNDILGYMGGVNQGAFIKTNSRHVIIRDNYLENQTELVGSTIPHKKVFAYIDCSLKDYSHIDTSLNYSYHIDITGNRCDAYNSSASYLYFINENFKSLNLQEVPNFGVAGTVIGSTFAKMEKTGENNTYKGIAVNKILVKVKDTQYEKHINMVNCNSFKNWENFSSSEVFTNNSNGDIIIDSRTISSVCDHSSPQNTSPSPPTFNPRSFILDAGSSNCNGQTGCPPIFFRIDQNADQGDFSDVFEKMAITLKVRNLPMSGNTSEVTDDLFLRIDELNGTSWVPKFTIPSIDIKNGTAYSVLRFTLDMTFDATKRYQLAISSKSNYVKEFKEIIFEDDTPKPNPLTLSGSTQINENSTVGATITATLERPCTNQTIVSLAYSGTASSADYTAPTTLVINANQTTGSIVLLPTSDNLNEPTETVIIDVDTITGDSSIIENGTQNATVSIINGLFAPLRNESPKETIQTLTVKVNNEVSAHPNPVQSNLTIDIKDGDEIKSIEIYAESGAFIGDYTSKVNNNTIDISHLPNATYLVKVTTIAKSTEYIIKE